jgi:integrase
MAVHLYLNRRPEYPANRPVAVVIRIRRHRTHRLSVATPIRVAPRNWSEPFERLKPSVPGATEVNATLQGLRAYAETILASGLDDAAIRSAIRKRMGLGTSEPVVRLLDLYDEFLALKRKRLQRGTAVWYGTLRAHLAGFAGAEAGVERVVPSFLADFAAYLLGEGLVNTTINKLLTGAREFTAMLARRELIARVPEWKPLPEPKNPVIYVTVEELAKIRDADLSDLSPGHRDARLLFLVGAMTGPRYGDLQGMRWEHLDLKERWWSLREQKTDRLTKVPLPTPVVRIIEARAGLPTPLPQLSNQKANDYIKEICRLAGLDTPVTEQVMKGGERTTLTRPKWEAITTHVARKTFITRALQEGTPLTELLGFTHSDLRSIQAYIGQSEEQRRGHVDRIFGGL